MWVKIKTVDQAIELAQKSRDFVGMTPEGLFEVGPSVAHMTEGTIELGSFPHYADAKDREREYPSRAGQIRLRYRDTVAFMDAVKERVEREYTERLLASLHQKST